MMLKNSCINVEIPTQISKFLWEMDPYPKPDRGCRKTLLKLMKSVEMLKLQVGYFETPSHILPCHMVEKNSRC